MPQLKGGPPREILEETVSPLQRYQYDSAFPSPITVVSDSYFGSLHNCEIGFPTVRHIMAMRCTNFCSHISAWLKRGESRTVSVGGRLVASFVDNKTMNCVSTSHRPKGSEDRIVTDLPGVSHKGSDLAALDSQSPHSYTKE